MNAREVDRVIERLAMLASGAEPEAPERGICLDVERNCYGASLDLLPRTWEEMGLHPVNPIGGHHYSSYGYGPQWTGYLGMLRRDLCKRTVFHLVRTHGYQGDWA